MSQTQIRGSSQIKSGSIVNANIANSTIAYGKLDAANSPSTDDILSFNGTKFNWVNKFTIQSGLDFKESVRAATTANITLSGVQTIDGVSLVAGNRVLVKNQTTASANGIYVVAAGAWSRAADAVQGLLTASMFCFVEEGTTQGDTGWVLTTKDPITVGTTALAFTQFSGAGAVTVTGTAPITVTGNNISLTLATTPGLEVNGGGLRVMTGAGLERHSSGLRIAPGGVKTTELDDNAVTTGKILNSNVTYAKIQNGGSLSVLGRSANSSGVLADISAGVDGHVLRRSGTTLGFGTIATAGITDAAVTFAKIQNIGALSVFGRSANSSGVGADISAGTDGHVLRRSGTTLGFGQVGNTGIENSAVDYNKIDRNSSAGAFCLIGADPGTDMKFLNAFMHYNVLPTGTINGSNVTFTVPNTPIAGSVQVYHNGVRMRPGATEDYQISGSTITMAVAPETGDIVVIDYIQVI